MSIKTEKPFCSFCNSENVNLIAPFGTAQLVRQFYCTDCKSVFEYIRWRDEDQNKHTEHSKTWMINK